MYYMQNCKSIQFVEIKVIVILKVLLKLKQNHS